MRRVVGSGKYKGTTLLDFDPVFELTQPWICVYSVHRRRLLKRWQNSKSVEIFRFVILSFHYWSRSEVTQGQSLPPKEKRSQGQVKLKRFICHAFWCSSSQKLHNSIRSPIRHDEETWLFRWTCRSKGTWKKVLGAGCQISNGTGHNPGEVSTAYILDKNRLCFVNELIVALLDQVVVLPQIDGLVRRGITLVRSLSMPIEVNFPGC